jgi:hypothetical protein
MLIMTLKKKRSIIIHQSALYSIHYVAVAGLGEEKAPTKKSVTTLYEHDFYERLHKGQS